MYWSQIGPQHAPQSVVGVAASASGGIGRPLLLLWWLLSLLHDDGIGGSDDNIGVGKFVAVSADIFGDVIETMSPDITGFMSMSTAKLQKTKQKYNETELNSIFGMKIFILWKIQVKCEIRFGSVDRMHFFHRKLVYRRQKKCHSPKNWNIRWADCVCAVIAHMKIIT